MSRRRRRRAATGRRRNVEQLSRIDFAAAVASGVLLAASYAKLAIWPLVFVALAPLLSRCAHHRRSQVLALGWLAGSAFYLLAFYWVLPTIARLQDLSLAASFPIFLVFLAYHGLAFGLFALAVRESTWPSSPIVIRSFAVAATWVLLEWIYPRVIPWYLGDALGPSDALRQAADLFGVLGLSFAIASANALLAAAIASEGRRQRLVIGAVLIPVALGVYGFTLSEGEQLASAASLEVLAVQGNVAPDGRPPEADNAESWRVYERLTVDALRGGPNVDLIVWPETTLRSKLMADAIWRRRVEQLVRELDQPVLLGALARANERTKEHNAAVLIDPVSRAGRPQLAPVPARQVYQKQILLPFGEYIPGPDWLISEWETTGRFVPGDGPPVLRLLPVDEPMQSPRSIGLSICFEAIFPGFFNSAARQGAEVLFNLTDDGWFGDTAEPHQHLNAARMRAVETRRPLVRVSNSGVTALVTPRGEIVDPVGYGAAGTRVYAIRTDEWERPLYVRIGDSPFLALCGLLIVVHLCWTRVGYPAAALLRRDEKLIDPWPRRVGSLATRECRAATPFVTPGRSERTRRPAVRPRRRSIRRTPRSCP